MTPDPTSPAPVPGPAGPAGAASPTSPARVAPRETYCGVCGTLAAAPHLACQARLDLEPPRYCAHCARRMVVQVTPTGWTARCSRHGELRS